MALSDHPGLPAHWGGETASDEVTCEDAEHTYKEVDRKERGWGGGMAMRYI